MRLTRASVLVVAVLAQPSPHGASAAEPARPASAQACPDSIARVIARSALDRRDACFGAKAALAFFGQLGVSPTEPVVIEIAKALPDEAGPTAAGCFMESRKRIFMLPYREFQKQKTWFELPIDRAMYRSLATHETAHALASCHFAIPRPTIQAKEYVAYVAMLSTMYPTVRARVLLAFPGAGFESEDRIAPMFYMFDPMRFGVESYRHHLRPGVGSDFLKSLLAGKALLE